MTADQAVAQVLNALEEAGIPYMIVGSWAGSVHGEPRATHDIDVVVQVSQDSFRQFIQALGTDFYVPAKGWDALASGRTMNVVHVETGAKVDLIPLRDRAYSRTEFSRRMWAEVLGKLRPVASPEDVVLSKLEWVKQGGGQRHIEDAIGVAQVQGSALDWDYVFRWGSVLGVGDLVEQVKNAVKG